MEEVENLPKIAETSERLRKILQYRKEELLSISIYLFLVELKNLLVANPKLTFSDLFFELIIRLAQGLYIKSLILLNPSAPEEETEEISTRVVSERQFYLYNYLPFDRVLEDKVFIPKVSLEELVENYSDGGDLSKIISAFIEVLERVRAEPQLVLELNRQSIDKIAEELRETIAHRKSLTWSELTEERALKSREAIVFAFLALLFLVFEGFCGVHQDVENCIHIYLKT